VKGLCSRHRENGGVVAHLPFPRGAGTPEPRPAPGNWDPEAGSSSKTLFAATYEARCRLRGVLGALGDPTARRTQEAPDRAEHVGGPRRASEASVPFPVVGSLRGIPILSSFDRWKRLKKDCLHHNACTTMKHYSFAEPDHALPANSQSARRPVPSAGFSR